MPTGTFIIAFEWSCGSAEVRTGKDSMLDKQPLQLRRTVPTIVLGSQQRFWPHWTPKLQAEGFCRSHLLSACLYTCPVTHKWHFLQHVSNFVGNFSTLQFSIFERGSLNLQVKRLHLHYSTVHSSQFSRTRYIFEFGLFWEVGKVLRTL
jgi:hypothetical protein